MTDRITLANGSTITTAPGEALLKGYSPAPFAYLYPEQWADLQRDLCRRPKPLRRKVKPYRGGPSKQQQRAWARNEARRSMENCFSFQGRAGRRALQRFNKAELLEQWQQTVRESSWPQRYALDGLAFPRGEDDG